ncbi:hypothetical protein HPB52_011090 [Rhipicephalus sanguineus]|uniref:Uncharacterized protein n=1 Tax=Rhipicephalus sanguineus TaxID=34632 RepID=A0A9D4Q6A7_RHISA|nr:hypothetical protein HPB52_011090 [Rhipicephalus sanguineus]
MREQNLDPYVDAPDRDDSSSSASTSDDPDFDRPPLPQAGRLGNVDRRMSTCRVLLDGVEVDVCAAVDLNGQPVLDNGGQVYITKVSAGTSSATSFQPGTSPDETAQDMGCDEADSPPPSPPSPRPPPCTSGLNAPHRPKACQPKNPGRTVRVPRLTASSAISTLLRTSREKWRKECQSMEEERLMIEERQHQELLPVIWQLTTAVTKLLPQGANIDGEEM